MRASTAGFMGVIHACQWIYNRYKETKDNPAIQKDSTSTLRKFFGLSPTIKQPNCLNDILDTVLKKNSEYNKEVNNIITSLFKQRLEAKQKK